MSDYTYPVELIKKAEARIRTQMNGNGIDPKNIHLTVKRQAIGIFTAETRYDPDVKITTSFDKGKKSQGKIVASGKMTEEVTAYIEGLAAKESLDTTAREHIKSLPLDGFGADKIEIGLKDDKISFTEQIGCDRCHGHGQSQCVQCHGRARMQCQLCYAQGYIQCLMCHGKGQVQDGDSMKFCNHCQGKGRTFCTQCQGQKEIPCTQCSATGMTKCTDCNGEGVNSSHTTVEPYLKISSAINIQELDNEPKTFASKVGPLNLAKNGHIDIQSIKTPKIEEEEERAYYEDEPEDSTKNTVYYQATMPWAVGTIEINDQSYKICFVGKKGAICDSGHFMDDILQPQLQLLSNAAKGNGFVAGLLKDACDFRVSRETLSAVAQYPKKKAMMAIHKKYNVGLTKQTLQSMIQNSYLALKRVTRRPRYIGLGIGLILSAALYYYWFMNGGRAQTLSHPTNIRYTMDAIPLIMGLILTIISIKGAAYFTFTSVMKDIGINTKKMPPLGRAGIFAFIGNIVLWGGIFAAAIFNLY